jgi:hypothetical protein
MQTKFVRAQRATGAEVVCRHRGAPVHIGAGAGTRGINVRPSGGGRLLIQTNELIIMCARMSIYLHRGIAPHTTGGKLIRGISLTVGRDAYWERYLFN